jgi:hypothetical protein
VGLSVSLDDVERIKFFITGTRTLTFRPHYGPGVDSASNRNEYQESLKIKKSGGKVRLARRADNLAAIY